MLSFEQIKELIQLISERRLQGLELERAGFRLKIDGQAPPVVAAAAPAPPTAAAGTPSAPAAAPAAHPPAPAAPVSASEGAHIVVSPIVGTFYRASSPDADPFVSVGSRVRKGQVLCIIEAMKLMNEIESDVDGVIVEIYPQNAQAVEFGEPLFAIRTD